VSLDLIDWYLVEQRQLGRAAATIGLRARVLTRAHTDLPFGLDQAGDDELLAWLARWRGQTRATYHASLASFYDWAVRRGHLDWNPTAEIPRPYVPPGVPRPVSDEQLTLLFASAAEPFRTWALIAAYEGLRCIEVARLRREHVTARAVEVRAGKGGRARVVPTHELVWTALRGLPAGPVAWMRTGRPATAPYISQKAGAHFRELGVPVSMHRLRHWFGTWVLRNSKNPRVAQVLLGHARLDTTMVYTQVASDEAWAAVSALPSMAAR
jgi:integrase